MSSKELIESGILEMYVMGMASESEQEQVELLAATNPDIRKEIDAISEAMESYAMAQEMTPSITIKPFVIATIDYTERLQSGEPVSFPPVLNEQSTIEDYAPWLNRPDMVQNEATKDNIFAKIIGYTPKVISAIVWIKDATPREIHDHEHERFLIVEGTCTIMVGDKANLLVPGDYFAIPLHEYHTVQVTSTIGCKVILQRVAA